MANMVGHIRESIIKTEVGIRGPDLIAITGNTITVIDLTIAAYHISPHIAYKQKCAY